VAAACLLCAGAWGALMAGPVEHVLWVSTAISLRPAIAEGQALFEADNPGIELLINSAGSGVLLQQVRRGAPVDLFVSASPWEIDRLEAANLIVPGSRATLATNRLVVVVPAGSPVPRSAEELAGPGFDRIALGNPKTAPVGRYAREALSTLGLWPVLRDRVVLGENARQVLEYTARGEVSAAVLYHTDVRLAGDRVSLGPEISPGTHSPIIYQACVLRDARHPSSARRFIDLMLSDTGKRILERHGFEVAESR